MLDDGSGTTSTTSKMYVLEQRAMSSKGNYHEDHITHCAFDGQILTTVNGRSHGDEIPIPRFRTQCLQRHALERIDVFIRGEFKSINRSEDPFHTNSHTRTHPWLPNCQAKSAPTPNNHTAGMKHLRLGPLSAPTHTDLQTIHSPSGSQSMLLSSSYEANRACNVDAATISDADGSNTTLEYGRDRGRERFGSEVSNSTSGTHSRRLGPWKQTFSLTPRGRASRGGTTSPTSSEYTKNSPFDSHNEHAVKACTTAWPLGNSL